MRIKWEFRKYFRDYKFNSLFFKNLLLLQLLIIVPLAGAIIISYYAYDNMQRKELQVTTDKMVMDIYMDLERILKESSTELMYFGINSNVELFMYDDAVRQFNYKVSTIQDAIKMPVLAKDYVDDIYIYSLSNNRVIGVQGVAKYDSFHGRDVIETFLNQDGEESCLFVTESDARGYNKKYLTLLQSINYGSKIKGVSMMNIDINGIIKELTIPGTVDLYMTDGSRILLSTNHELIGQSADLIPVYGEIVHDGMGLKRDYVISSKVADTSGLEVITRVETSGYHNQLTTIRTVLLGLLAVMIAITTGLSAFISIRLFLPIDRIMSSLQKYQGVLMGEEELFKEKDELEYILNSIHKTAVVKKNVDEELTERIHLLKKAQAVALQSQINPHFLNNTLETINWTAMELLGGRNEISKMAGALSKMLRMTLENSDTIVPVKTEVEHCGYYLEIQQKRYEDKFDVIWQIPKEIMECKMIRIVLQPIVENAIYHGIKRLSSGGKITIAGRSDKEEVELTVADNGLGMTKEELRELRESMQSDMIKESCHIGVANVNQRLRLYFGENYGLQVDSREGSGTVVTVRFPKIL